MFFQTFNFGIARRSAILIGYVHEPFGDVLEESRARRDRSRHLFACLSASIAGEFTAVVVPFEEIQVHCTNSAANYAICRAADEEAT